MPGASSFFLLFLPFLFVYARALSYLFLGLLAQGEGGSGVLVVVVFCPFGASSLSK